MMKKLSFLKPQRREAEKVACDTLLCGMCNTLRASEGGTRDPKLGVLCRRRSRHHHLEAFWPPVQGAEVLHWLYRTLHFSQNVCFLA